MSKSQLRVNGKTFWYQVSRHTLVYFLLGLIGEYGPHYSMMYAFMFELGNQWAHNEDPIFHPEGFNIIDLLFRWVGALLAHIAIINFSLWS